MKKSQLLFILTLLTLLLAVNQFFTEHPSLRSYLGGLPWNGGVGISLFLALTGVAFALRAAKRARHLLEEPMEKHIDPNDQRIKLSHSLPENHDPPTPH